MARVCGPILGFRGRAGDEWHVVVMVAIAGNEVPPPLTWTFASNSGAAATIEARGVGEAGGYRFFVHPLAIRMMAQAQDIDYGFAGEDAHWRFSVPAATETPAVAYASCNDLSTSAERKQIEDKTALWQQVLERHNDRPFHLLLMGGDQIYADHIWLDVEELRGFDELSRDARINRVSSPALADAIERFYADTYRQRFSQPRIAAALACIPTLMMWDDHDIIDGWGSYSREEQASPVFAAIFAAARRCFALFQLHSDPMAPDWPRLAGSAGFNALIPVGDIAFLVLDLRSERTRKQVMTAASWDAVFAAIDATDGLKHLLVMSSIPVVHADLSLAERALDIVPGRQDLEDDLHDQWTSYEHRIERLRVIRRLLSFADAKGTRVTILSGDVHVAALGVIEWQRPSARWQNAGVINQLTSSGIVHTPPPRIVRNFLEVIARATDPTDRDITARLLEFPGTRLRIIGARNWLSLEFDATFRMWANWHVEGDDTPLTKVVHPCAPAVAGAIASD
ncbi:MAG: alkaline phosphatase family protein [Rhodospirillales bacterium]|nr:alkaline phosphatase family protein [Rhodospirillales bacterium]